MEFIIRKARNQDLGAIMQIMEAAKQDARNSRWFVADEEAYVRAHLEENGFTVVAQTLEGAVAGFFIIKFPEGEDNLGIYLDFSPEELKATAVMDSAAVDSAYRGNGLQGKMLDYAEEQLGKEHYTNLLCTIHPDNQFSLSNMQKAGYDVKKTIYCYGGLKRYLLLKKVSPHKI